MADEKPHPDDAAKAVIEQMIQTAAQHGFYLCRDVNFSLTAKELDTELIRVLGEFPKHTYSGAEFPGMILSHDAVDRMIQATRDLCEVVRGNEASVFISTHDVEEAIADAAPVTAYVKAADSSEPHEGRKVPISAARRISANWGFEQVIVIARHPGNDGFEQVVTYGEGKDNSQAAARAGMAIKHHLMRWPVALFDSDLQVTRVAHDPDNHRIVCVHLARSATDAEVKGIRDMLNLETFAPEKIDEGA